MKTIITVLLFTSLSASAFAEVAPCTVSLKEKGGTGFSSLVNEHVTAALSQIGCSVVKEDAKYTISWGFGCIQYAPSTRGSRILNRIANPIIGNPQNLIATLKSTDGSISLNASKTVMARSFDSEPGRITNGVLTKAEKILLTFVTDIQDAESETQD